MANITLTDHDLRDLSAGHTINAMADDGSEHVLGPDDINRDELLAIDDGRIITLGDHLVNAE